MSKNLKLSLGLSLPFHEGIRVPYLVFIGSFPAIYVSVRIYIEISGSSSTINPQNVGADNENNAQKQPGYFRIPGIFLASVPMFFSYQNSGIK